ncbi:hypothetical protein D3C84_1038410 [compost metagenome]
MQRRQRRAQVVGDVRHQFATLLVLAGQGTPLLAQARLHLPERGVEYGDLIMAGGFVHSDGQGRRDRDAVDVELADGVGQAAQGPGDQRERGETGNQAQ